MISNIYYVLKGDIRVLYIFKKFLEEWYVVPYLHYLQEVNLLRTVGGMARGNRYILKSDKIYLHNTNLLEVLCTNSNIGTIRGTFFASQVHHKYTLHYPRFGDFQVNEKYYFEIGGPNKEFVQIKDVQNSFLVKDRIESGYKNSTPLWLFGFLY